MARPITATKALTAADADNIALAQALAGAGLLTLNGVAVSGGVATLDTARRVGITSAGNDTGITFTIKGTDYSGNVISEVVTGANAAVASTLQDFLTVTSVRGSDAAAGNVSAGTTDVGSSPWFPLNNHITPFDVGVQTHLVSGAATWTIEVTRERVLSDMQIYRAGFTNAPSVPVAFGWPGLVGLAADASGSINSVVLAARLTILSGTGTVQADIVQTGISN